MKGIQGIAGLLLGLSVWSGAQAADPPPVKQVPTTVPTPWGTGEPERTLIYKKSVAVATDEKFGEIRTGLFCSNVQPLTLTSKIIPVLTNRFAPAARREFKRMGFKDASTEVSAFDSKPNAESGDYELAATLRGVEFQICSGGARDNAGGVWMRLNWELFSPKLQKVVYSLVTEGSFSSERKIEKSLDDYVDGAFLSALQNALADPGMAARLRADPAVPTAGDGAKPVELLAVARRPDPKEAPDEEFAAERSAVVTVQSGVGSGSGFYIDAGGYLLTNQHVVGDNRYVKVRLATGRDVVGEVLRSDKARDVALLKTESVSLRAFALASQAPSVGDAVFVIGSPFGDRFASSLTKGVLSGTPTFDQRKYLQSDTKVLPGNSGGPLIRRDGAVIGIVSGGYGEGAGASVNLFIPIDEAMSKIGLGFKP